MTIRQQGRESHHSYLSHFNMATLEVWELDQSVAMMALKSELQKNAFLFSLKKKSLKNFIEILAQVEKYTNAEEGYDAHLAPAKAKVEQKLGNSRPASTSRTNQRNQRGSYSLHLVNDLNFHKRIDRIGPYQGGVNLPPMRRYANYTLLNAPRGHILMVV